MKIIANINSLLSDDWKTSILPKAKLKKVEAAIEFEGASNNTIDPEDVIAWLVTQPNANGTLYLENVIRQYMRTLRTAPAKLKIPVVFEIRSVFNCHTPDELKACWDIFRAAPNYKQVNSSTSGMFSAGMSCYMKYLQHISGAAAMPEVADESQKPQPPKTEAGTTAEPINRVNFDRPELCAKTRPLTCTIKGRDVMLGNQKWSHLLVAITERFIADENPNLESLYTQPLHGSNVFFLAKKVEFRNCHLLSNDKWIYTNYNPQNIIRVIKNLCQHCSVDLDDVIITWEPNDGTPVRTVQTHSRPAYAAPAVPPNPTLDAVVVEQLTQVLSTHFANGYRLNSTIDLARLRSIAAEDLGAELTLTDEELIHHIAACGTTYDGKFYAVYAESKERIKGLAKDYAEAPTKSRNQVNFDHPELCAKTHPLTCIIKGQSVVPATQKWSQLLIAITERFIADGNPYLEALNNKPLYGRKAFFWPTKADFGTYHLLSNGKWINTKYDPQSIVMIIGKLCQHCGVDLDDVIITYEPNDGTPVRTVQTHSRPTYAGPSVPAKPTLDVAVVEHLAEVLSSRFANGYRLNSPIEIARLRSFAAEDLGAELTLTDKELEIYIAACGTIFDGKVYAVSEESKERIKGLAKDYFADGAQSIFYAEFYAKNESWLFEASVVSKDMLIKILRRLFPDLSFKNAYFGYTNASVSSVLKSEILRVWGEDMLLTYSQLAERLWYIPLERIRSALSQNSDFIWSSVETFSHVSRIDITDKQRQAIREAAVRECNAHGYASVTALPIEDIEAHNHELSITAVHNAVYRICLSEEFDKKGRIITRKGEKLDTLTIIREYCKQIDTCSFKDLMNFEKELTGEDHRWIAMEAANAVLVRIDKDAYVAERHVHFNADAIDEAIGLFVKGDYLPLRSFTTFGAFPNCGQTWNLFLLESYCRRFSQKFRFDALCVNSRNAGTVIRKSCGMDYMQIMTDAVATADVPLQDADVGRFLCKSGYTGRNTNAKVSEIIDKAKAIRESRD